MRGGLATRRRGCKGEKIWIVSCDVVQVLVEVAAGSGPGGWFLSLPPYRPDLTPIGMAVSKLKAHRRRIGA